MQTIKSRYLTIKNAIATIRNNSNTLITHPLNSTYDLVYIIKDGDPGHDLRVSLRSVEKFCPFRKIWIVGYRPKWVKGIRCIKTVQDSDKWKNSMINYTAACNHPEISENFVLMNDDFFALQPVRDWEMNLNVCLGTLNDAVAEYDAMTKKSRWRYGFGHAQNLLATLGCHDALNYEVHMPIIINKAKFLKMLEHPLVASFLSTRKVFHKRTVYKNVFAGETSLPTPRIITDVKIPINTDLTEEQAAGEWLSVFDNVVENPQEFPLANHLLNTMFSEKSVFEKWIA